MKKPSKIKKNFALAFVFTFVGIIYFKAHNSNLAPASGQVAATASPSAVQNNEDALAEKKAPARSIASIPANIPTPASSAKNPIRAALNKDTNQEEKEWKEKLKTRLKKSLASLGLEPKIKELGSRSIMRGNKSVSAEHVMVSIDKGKGYVSTYEALVDPDSGRVLQTWNKTRFEGKARRKLTLSPLRQ